MRKAQRAIQAAKRMLAEAGVDRAPVDVKKLARTHAQIVEQDMMDSVSGMLIPARLAGKHGRHVIVVNSSHAEVRKRFTIAHELGHLLLHNFDAPHADTAFRVRFRATMDYDGSVVEEIEANQFAAELLMPGQLLSEELANLDLEYAQESDNGPLDELAYRFKVSKQALQIRLSDFL